MCRSVYPEGMNALLLQASDLSAWRAAARGRAQVLDAVEIDVRAGQVVDISGPSGVGKSTLLLALARLLPGTSGRLALEGRPASDIDAREWRGQVLYVPQVASLGPRSVRGAMLLPWALRSRAGDGPPSELAIREALGMLGLADLSLDHEAQRLSVGQAARVALARAILTRPRVLLLDEPDANLDDEAAALADAATRQFADGGGAVIRVRHRGISDACDRRLRLEGGRLREVPDA